MAELQKSKTGSRHSFWHWGSWKIVLYAGLGSGIGGLVVTGILAHRGEILKFVFVVLILLVASRILFEPVVERVLGAYDPHSQETSKNRKDRRWMILATSFLALGLDKALDKQVQEDLKGTTVVLIFCMLYAGLITLGWLRGIQQNPPHAAKRGALTGLALGLPLALFSAGLFLLFYLTPDMPEMYRNQYFLLWFVGISALGGVGPAFIGYAGGLVIDRRFGVCRSRWVCYALVVSTLLYAVISIFVFHFFKSFLTKSFAHEDIDELIPMLSFSAILPQIGGAAGWGLGLMLHGDDCDEMLEIPDNGSEEQTELLSDKVN